MEPVALTVDGVDVTVSTDGSLLDALRDQCGVRSAKDGCAPQGQCGCCTVLVDGQPRVACVTSVARVAGRSVTTFEGLPEGPEWTQRFTDAGASQCGFCTPGIIVRLAAMPAERRTDPAVRQALLAHLCRCTGWNTIVDAAVAPVEVRGRDPQAAERRATIEGRSWQRVDAEVAAGLGGFAADTAPDGVLIALLDEQGTWVVAETIGATRQRAQRVQGRRTTLPLTWPIEVPSGEWAITLQTTWVEPAYLEPDAAWCHPGGEPSSSLGNGGAFGGKATSIVRDASRRLADEYGRPVLAMLTRDDVVRLGAKRPPIALGLRADGAGVLRIARTEGVVLPVGVEAEQVEVTGPLTSAHIRGAGWAEVAAARAVLGDGSVTAPDGGWARAEIGADGSIEVWVRAGEPLDDVVLRSYCIGAAHMALGWVRSEAIAVDDDGVPIDVTVRSAGVLRAVDTPPIVVHIEPSDAPAVNGSDAVFAAVAAAAWRHAGVPGRWPTMRT